MRYADEYEKVEAKAMKIGVIKAKERGNKRRIREEEREKRTEKEKAEKEEDNESKESDRGVGNLE